VVSPVGIEHTTNRLRGVPVTTHWRGTDVKPSMMGLEALRVTTDDIALPGKSGQPPIDRASDPEKLPGVRPAVRHDALISQPGVRPCPLRQVVPASGRVEVKVNEAIAAASRRETGGELERVIR